MYKESGKSMSNVIQKGYAEQAEKGYNSRTAMEEASRCLLCHDSPCSKGCPAGTDPGKFIRSLRFKNVKGAAETIRENNPLGGCCALVCPYDRLCEQACSRTGIDKPINIGKIQRYIVEQEKELGMEIVKATPATKGNVVCVGAGPASLACASTLAREGYQVTVLEAQEKAGGVLTFGIIPTRLPQDVVDYDISLIEKQGVKFEFNKKVNESDLADLKKKYDAVFIGAGLWKSKIPEIPGNDLKGVVSAIDYLKEAKVNAPKEEGDYVIVIGGGDVAMDCVITAKQLGAEKAKIVYRRTIGEAPSDIAEVNFVQGMGIPIIQEFAPAEIIGENGKVVGMRFTGRDGYSQMTVKADKVVFAIGQAVEESLANVKESDGIFMGGDFSNGGKTVVEAVAEGKDVAMKITEYLSK